MLSEALNLSFLEPLLGWIHFNYHNSEVSLEALGINGLIEFIIRKGAHFVAFYILLTLFYLAFRKTVHWRVTRIVTVSFTLTIAYAVMDELHQGLTPNRTPYIGDVFIDGFGAATACIILLLVNESNRKVRRF